MRNILFLLVKLCSMSISNSERFLFINCLLQMDTCDNQRILLRCCSTEGHQRFEWLYSRRCLHNSFSLSLPRSHRHPHILVFHELNSCWRSVLLLDSTLSMPASLPLSYSPIMNCSKYNCIFLLLLLPLSLFSLFSLLSESTRSFSLLARSLLPVLYRVETTITVAVRVQRLNDLFFFSLSFLLLLLSFLLLLLLHRRATNYY